MKIDQYLTYLVSNKGSDLHMLAGLPPCVRIHGELKPIPGEDSLSVEQMRYIVYELLSDEQKEIFERDKELRYELDFAYSLEGVARFRFNVHKQRGSVGCVARALSTRIPEFSQLGLPESISKFTEAKKGMALVTGPTGSGKSTTLAAVINKINESRHDHIITIEDPVEYVHQSKMSMVMQREVGSAADTMSFKNALRAALRQDPDVILIGEMRDFETIGIAITSAETGHLVFGTLHTSSAAQTISRIIDVFPTDQVQQVKTQLAGNIFGICSQVLLPKLGGGRVCCCEILYTTPAIRNNIRMNNLDQIYQSIQTGGNDGMITMDASVAAKVRAKEVSFEVARPFLRDESSRRNLEEYAEKPPEPVKTPEEIEAEAAAAAAAAAAAEEKVEKRIPLGAKVVIPPWEMQKKRDDEPAS